MANEKKKTAGKKDEKKDEKKAVAQGMQPAVAKDKKGKKGKKDG